MNINELVRNHTWCSRAEQAVLERVNDLLPLSAFDENDQFIIEGLIRKSLIIKVHSKADPEVIYIYPNA